MSSFHPFGGRSAAAGTILIASTCWWAFPARIAMEFAAMGFRVEATCPLGHPLRSTRAVDRLHHYRPLDPLGGLAAAIAAAQPTLIVPCDDRAVTHLHALHARLSAAASPEAALRDAALPPARPPPRDARAALIERSLGAARFYPIADSRTDLIDAAREAGIPAPAMYSVGNRDELRRALTQLGFPAVMKVDGTWGGLGVMVIDNLLHAEQAFAKASRRLTARQVIKRLLVDRDPMHVLPWLAGGRPKVSVQRFVQGRPAFCAVSCWEGRVLAAISMEVLNAHNPVGASTIVRRVDHPLMEDAAARLVGRLKLSGLCGLDFVIETATGQPFLVELNARSTPVCHLALGEGRDLLTTLASSATGSPIAERPLLTANDTIAFFPQAWLLEPGNPLLKTGHHDVPWEDPVLMRELLRLPWPDRGWLARALSRHRKGRSALGADRNEKTVFAGMIAAEAPARWDRQTAATSD